MKDPFDTKGCDNSIKVATEIPNQFTKAHPHDAGYDIIASMDGTVPVGGKKTFHTGLKVAIPVGFVGVIKSRSGLAGKHNLEVGAGVIDCGYTGEVRVILRNFGEIPYEVKCGDKIAQMLVLPIFTGFTRFVESLEDTDRGDNGFNSTGYKHD